MDLIIGGAYQGKLDCAKKRFHLNRKEIFTCTEETAQPDFSYRCLDRLEEYVLCCVRREIDPVAAFREKEEQWADSVLICCDIFCGVVPAEAEMRAWREATGRLAAYLSQRAATVTRVFCGLEQRLK